MNLTRITLPFVSFAVLVLTSTLTQAGKICNDGSDRIATVIPSTEVPTPEPTTEAPTPGSTTATPSVALNPFSGSVTLYESSGFTGDWMVAEVTTANRCFNLAGCFDNRMSTCKFQSSDGNVQIAFYENENCAGTSFSLLAGINSQVCDFSFAGLDNAVSSFAFLTNTVSTTGFMNGIASACPSGEPDRRMQYALLRGSSD